MFKPLIAAALATALTAGAAAAQGTPNVPPQNAMKLSAILAKVEGRPDFRYIEEVEWDDGGYVVTYYTTDGAKVEIKFDPVSGQTRSMR